VAAELAGALWGEADVAADDDARIQDAADDGNDAPAALSTEDW
jgi:hypothetical protein